MYMAVFCSQMIQTDNGDVCGSNDCNFQADGTTATFRVMFKEPIEIQPNTSYTASATLKVRSPVSITSDGHVCFCDAFAGT